MRWLHNRWRLGNRVRWRSDRRWLDDRWLSNHWLDRWRDGRWLDDRWRGRWLDDRLRDRWLGDRLGWRGRCGRRGRSSWRWWQPSSFRLLFRSCFWQPFWRCSQTIVHPRRYRETIQNRIRLKLCHTPAVSLARP